MVLCVNQELAMGKGKIAAQCAHAAVGACDRFQRKMPTWFAQWRKMGQTKIALKANKTADLMKLASSGALAVGGGRAPDASTLRSARPLRARARPDPCSGVGMMAAALRTHVRREFAVHSTVALEQCC